jgi:hypothetical protein
MKFIHSNDLFFFNINSNLLFEKLKEKISTNFQFEFNFYYEDLRNIILIDFINKSLNLV